MRVAIYARVSSQAQKERHTIENQLRELTAYVRAMGWTLAGTYVDDGRSAKAGKLVTRGGFAELLLAAEEKSFDILLVTDIDRLTRTDDMRERAAILGPFQRAGIRIVTPAGGELDLRTFLGELYVTMQALVAAEENRKRAERIKAGKLRAIAEGRKPAGPTPYGLAYDRAAGRWSVDEAEAAIVREVYRRVIAGESCMVIADDLDERAVPPPRGRWTRHTVWQLLRKRHPVGEWTADKRRRLTIAVPAIVTEETWRAAELALLAAGKRGLVKTKHVYFLEGLAVCGICGSPIAIRSRTVGRRGLTNPSAYVCRARKLARRGETRCPAEIARTADVDARVWDVVARELESPELAAELRRRMDGQAENAAAWARDAATYRARLADLVKRETGLIARWQRGTVSDEAFDAALQALKRDRAAVKAQLDAADSAVKAAGEPAADVSALVGELRALAASLDPGARQRVVRAMVAPGGAVFDRGRVKLTLLVAAASRGASVGGPLSVVPAVSAGYRTHHETIVRIRVVA